MEVFVNILHLFSFLSAIYTCFSILGSIILASMILFWLYQLYLPKDYVKDFNKKCILVTGCDSGFGNALVKQLDKIGCKVFATCFTENGMRQIKEECSGNVLSLLMDVTDDESIERAFKKVESNLKNNEVIWGVVNNAGVYMPFFTVELYSVEQYQRTFDVNTLGAVRITKKFLPLLKKSKGRVVNTISISGKVSFPLVAPYSMSKYAMEAFTDCCRIEFSRWGISVHGIEPGAFKTPMTSHEWTINRFEKQWEGLDDSTKEEYEDYRIHAKSKLEVSSYYSSKNITPVTNAMEHALFSKSAKPKYMVGNDHLFLFSWLLLFPSFILDKLWASQLMTFNNNNTNNNNNKYQ